MDRPTLGSTAKQLVAEGKGILAADWSLKTSEKHFKRNGIEDTEENRRAYRELLFVTPEIENYISGVIMFDETIRQSTSGGISFPRYLAGRGIIPGIKVDQGKEEFPGSPQEFITKGLDGLDARLEEYKKLGARFTKWRALFVVGDGLPSDKAIDRNAEILAEYALITQNHGLVPIIEPEVLMEGGHTITESEQANYRVLKKVFLELEKKGVNYRGMLLKPSWVHPGKESEKPSDKEVAKATLKVLAETVSDEIPGIMFLSGGDSPEDSTGHLDALNEEGNFPWELSFSFGRALKEPTLRRWGGKSENKDAAQKEFVKRAYMNSLARSGKYDKTMEGQDE